MVKPKVRGRRAEKAAKVEKEENDVPILQDETQKESEQSEGANQNKSVFFGLVDASELDYFKQAESTLNINAFESPEEREGFIRSVLEEARGKELKLVTNQICSKLMERLVLFASDRQLKRLMKLFSSHVLELASHKYSSHVLETLLVRAAALVEKELIIGDKLPEQGDEEEEKEDEEEAVYDVAEPVELLMISMINEIKPNLKAMIDHQYASHVLRLIILIVAGKELPSTTTSNSTLRSKKSKIARKMIEIKDNEDFNRAFQTPPSFKNELKDICNSISKGQEMKKMRELAIHKISSPVLQLLIQVEGIVDRDRTFWHLIFLKDSEEKDPQEEAFVEYLLSDSVGSHFLESVINNGGARLKYVERLYRLYMKERVLRLTKRSTTGVYIIQALLFKLKPSEVEFMLDQIIPELSTLISVSENQNLDFGSKVIDASIARNNYRRDEIIEKLFIKFAPNYNYKNPDTNTSSEFLENVLQLTGSTLGNKRDDWPTAEERRRSLFLEKLMEYEYNFVVCVWLNFLALPAERFIQMCYHGVFSHVVEHSLKISKASEPEPKNILILRKRFLNLFQGNIVNMSCNSYGSHIVDKLWYFTIFLPMYKDRVASELYAESSKVKESTYGRLVWKNWSMELFSRKKYDWKALIKQQEEEYYSEGKQGNEEHERAKKPIELKMERLAKEKQLQEEKALHAEENYKKRKNFEEQYSFDSFDDKRQKLRGRRR